MSATTEQRLTNLKRANEIRVGHANIRRYISTLTRRDGEQLVCDMLANPTGMVPSMRIDSLLLSINRVGKHILGRWINRAEVRSNRRVDELTERQRLALVAAIQKGWES